MKLLKKIHRNDSEIDFQSIWKEGTFVFDTNVLLDLYRLPTSSREDLISVLNNENFKDRIWIGFQVLLEFLNNKIAVISDQKNKFTEVKKILNSSIEKYDDSFKTLNTELNKLKLNQRHSLIEPDKYINPENIEKGKKFIKNFIEHLQDLERKQFDVNDEDEIKNKVLNIFENKVGEAFTKDELSKIYELGEERYKAQIPPGYKDSDKKGEYVYKENQFIRKFGDLVLWKEIIKKSKEENLKFVVLITGDIKEDWWEIRRGKKLRSRTELLNEIYTQCPNLDTFYIYDTSSFLKHAKTEINNNIKDSSIKDTRELIDQNIENRKESAFKFLKKRKLKEEIETLNKDIETCETQLESTKKSLKKTIDYQNNLYETTDSTDELRQHAHNLSYQILEDEELIKELIDQISIRKEKIETIKIEIDKLK